jgi:phage recombination protein Bet
MTKEIPVQEKQTPITLLAGRYNIDPIEMQKTLKGTVVPNGTTDAEFAAFLMVAYEYKLNPILREIYAFPKKGGGIQPIVSIDGWMNIINSHPQFDGLTFDEKLENGKIVSITAKIFRKDRSHSVDVTEYMAECARGTEPWKQWPARMLRHKAAIQAARYAFGFSGIMEPDEAERMLDVTPNQPTGFATKLAEAAKKRKEQQPEIIIAETGEVVTTQPEEEGRLSSIIATPLVDIILPDESPSTFGIGGAISPPELVQLIGSWAVEDRTKFIIKNEDVLIAINARLIAAGLGKAAERLNEMRVDIQQNGGLIYGGLI